MLGIFDWIGDFFKSLFDLIPKVMYLLYASLACVLDVFQLLFRKLAGLDVYYIDGQQQTGDIVLGFITGILGIRSDGFEYSVLSTVFWAFIIFGIIICFVSTVIAIVKSHYSYDDKSAKGPMQYVYTAGKAVINMIAVPIIVILGLLLSQGVLTALDSITSITSGSVVDLYGEGTEQDDQGNTISAAKQYLQSIETASGDTTYIYYDIFGFTGGIVYGTLDYDFETGWTLPEIAKIGAANQTFSGSLFRVAAYNANRVRTSKTTNMSGFLENQIFHNGAFEGEPTSDQSDQVETAAEMVDTAFANSLHLKDGMQLDNTLQGGWSSASYFTNFLCPGVSVFSKFNVGAVWYYYDLWSFNFIVGFGGCIVCVFLFINIILGLISRIFMMLGLFLVAPPLFGLAPLDGGNAGKSWRGKFIGQALMAYGAVVGMNLFFIIMPYINQIDFFNIPIADYFVNILVIIVGFITIKAFISMLSSLIGAEDANKTGEGINKEVGGAIKTAGKLAVGAAMVGGRAMGAGLKTVGGIATGIDNMTGNRISERFDSVADSFGNSRVGQALSKAGSKIKGAAKWTKDKAVKLKKRWTGEDLVDDARKGVEDLNEFRKKDEFLNSLTDQTVGANGAIDEEAIKVRAKNAGFDDKYINNIVNVAKNAAQGKAAGSKLGLDDLRASLEKSDLKFKNQVNDGLLDKVKFDNSMVVAQDRLQKVQKDYEKQRQLGFSVNAQKALIGDKDHPGVFRAMSSNFSTLFGASGDIGKGLSEIRNKPEKPNKVEDKGLAETTAKQATAIGEKLDKLDKTMTDLANTLTNLNNKNNGKTP